MILEYLMHWYGKYVAPVVGSAGLCRDLVIAQPVRIAKNAQPIRDAVLMQPIREIEFCE